MEQQLNPYNWNVFAGTVSLLACLLCVPLGLVGQESEKKPISKGIAGGISMGNHGPGMDLWVFRGPEHQQYVFGLNAHLLKDPHETRIPSNFGEQGNNYVYGKTHHFLGVHPTVGIQRLLIPRSSLNVASVWGGMQAGPSFGLLNPYYLEIFQPNPSAPLDGNRSIRAYDPDEHTYGRIVGRASLLSSPIQPQLIMGGSIQAYLLIDTSRKPRYLSTLKLGATLEGYSQKFSLMTHSEDIQPRRWFLALSAGLLLGNRW